jgi:hypothetical protein
VVVMPKNSTPAPFDRPRAPRAAAAAWWWPSHEGPPGLAMRA